MTTHYYDDTIRRHSIEVWKWKLYFTVTSTYVSSLIRQGKSATLGPYNCLLEEVHQGHNVNDVPDSKNVETKK